MVLRYALLSKSGGHRSVVKDGDAARWEKNICLPLACFLSSFVLSYYSIGNKVWHLRYYIIAGLFHGSLRFSHGTSPRDG